MTTVGGQGHPNPGLYRHAAGKVDDIEINFRGRVVIPLYKWRHLNTSQKEADLTGCTVDSNRQHVELLEQVEALQATFRPACTGSWARVTAAVPAATRLELLEEPLLHSVAKDLLDLRASLARSPGTRCRAVAPRNSRGIRAGMGSPRVARCEIHYIAVEPSVAADTKKKQTASDDGALRRYVAERRCCTKLRNPTSCSVV